MPTMGLFMCLFEFFRAFQKTCFYNNTFILSDSFVYAVILFLKCLFSIFSGSTHMLHLLFLPLLHRQMYRS